MFSNLFPIKIRMCDGYKILLTAMTVFSLNFALAEIPETDLETIRNYGHGLAFLNNVGMNRQQPMNPPTFLSQRVQAAAIQCFPENEGARNWVERMLNMGHPSVWATFFIQDFRNSEVGTRLRAQYQAADTAGKQQLQQQMRELFSNQMVYEMLMESSFRPLMFRGPQTAPERLEECNANHTSQSQWDDIIRDPADGLPKVEIRHWDCDQPQIYYFSYFRKNDEDTTPLDANNWSNTHYRSQDGSFTFYLGNKGFWSLATYGNSVLIEGQPPNGIGGMFSEESAQWRANRDAFEATNYCPNGENSCDRGRIPSNYRFSEAEGRRCLREFFTGSAEALNPPSGGSPVAPPPRSGAVEATNNGGTN